MLRAARGGWSSHDYQQFDAEVVRSDFTAAVINSDEEGSVGPCGMDERVVAEVYEVAIEIDQAYVSIRQRCGLALQCDRVGLARGEVDAEPVRIERYAELAGQGLAGAICPVVLLSPA